MLRDVASDLAAVLESAGLSLARGSNLYLGGLPEDDDRTVTDTAVALLSTGGAAPQPYLGGHRTAYLRATCQVLVRGPREDFQAGQTLALAVYGALSMPVVSPYVSIQVRESAPFQLPRDASDRPMWSLNVEASYLGTAP